MSPPPNEGPKADEAYQEAAEKAADDPQPQVPVMSCLPEGGRTPDYEPLRQALVAESVDKALAANVTGQLVAAGEELMVLPPPPPASDSGEEAAPAATLLEAGEGVREEQARLVAERYGYLYDTGKQLQVLSPLWVSSDGMQVCFLHFRQLRAPARLDRPGLQQMLADVGAVADPEEDAVAELTAGLPPAEARGVLLMNGEPAQRGEDGKVDYTFDPEVRAGKLQDDGSVDLRERNSSIGVTEGQELATVHPPTEGTAGRNVRGQDVAAEDGTAAEVTAGTNVAVASGDGGVTVFTSQIAGNVHVKNGQIEVTPVFRVGGDLTYETGNVDVEGDVEISGSVLAGFTVKAGGDITISGTVENGVHLTARGDIIVAQGILGEDTQVAAVRELTARFIQNAHAMVGGDVTIGNYLYNVDVRSGGHISVSDAGGGRSGTIAGGQVLATGGIDACYVGSRSGDSTVVGVDGTPADTVRVEQLTEALKEQDGRVMRLLRTLGITQIDADVVTRLIKAASPSQRVKIVAFVKRLRTLLAEREVAATEREELLVKIHEQVKSGVVEVTKEVYAGTEIRFAQQSVPIVAKAPPSVYFFSDEEIKSRSYVTAAEEGEEGADAEGDAQADEQADGQADEQGEEG